MEKTHDGDVFPAIERDEDGSLMCYDIKDDKEGDFPKFVKRMVNVRDQFGRLTLQVEKPDMLCAPATVALLP